jgi:hypothetical protein
MVGLAECRRTKAGVDRLERSTYVSVLAVDALRESDGRLSLPM